MAAMSTTDSKAQSGRDALAPTRNGAAPNEGAPNRGARAVALPAPDWGEPLELSGEARYSQSLERGLAILLCFSSARPLLGIAELADMLGMSRSTTHRYVITLVALGYLRQGERRKYRLALRVTELGMSAMNSTSLREHAHQYLEELSRRSGYTVAVAVLDGSELLYVDRVGGRRRGQRLIELGLGTGSRLPAHQTAMGKLLLAYLPARERRELIAELRPGGGGPGALASKSALREQLEAIVEDGLASSHEELVAGLVAIAAPVRCESGEVVAAAGMGAHSSTISREGLIDQLGPHLISTADRISARLGYRRDDER